MVDNLNVKEVQEVLRELKNLDLKNVTAETIKQLLLKVYHHIGVQHRLEKGRYIQRSVFLDQESEDFFPKDSKRLSYNPNGSAMGRCNFDGESIFYGSIATDDIQGYDCAGLETLCLDLVGLRQSRYVTGNWVLTQDVELPFLGGASNLTYLSKDGKNRHETFHKFISTFKESILPLYSIDRFICDEFSKEVKKDEPWNYKISAVYTQMLKNSGLQGLMYPSVKSGGAGTNVIFFKDAVDDGLITFDKCAYGVYYTRDDQTVNEYLMNAVEVNGKLVWKDDYQGRIKKSIRDYYLGRTDVNPLEGRVPVIDFGNPKTKPLK